MVKQLTDEDYALFGDRADSPGEPGMQPLTEEGLAALEQAPPEPSQEELVEAAVAGYVPPETGTTPGWAKEWGYLPQKPWDQSYYDIPVARLMAPVGERGGKVRTVHEGDYVEGLGTVSTISMDPNGFHVSVEIAPDDENAPTFWIGGEPKDHKAVIDAVDPRDIDVLDRLVSMLRDSEEIARQRMPEWTKRAAALQRDASGQPLDPGRVLDEFGEGINTQQIIYGTDDQAKIDSMAKEDLRVMGEDSVAWETTSHEIDGTEWTRHSMMGSDGQRRVFYEDQSTGSVVNSTIPAEVSGFEHLSETAWGMPTE